MPDYTCETCGGKMIREEPIHGGGGVTCSANNAGYPFIGSTAVSFFPGEIRSSRPKAIVINRYTCQKCGKTKIIEESE
jgi:predicted RNA-binding Zn-ribbon protein involved in translation (DUF1610 family)